MLWVDAIEEAVAAANGHSDLYIQASGSWAAVIPDDGLQTELLLTASWTELLLRCQSALSALAWVVQDF